MNLENQVCSLELSKQLKELGVKQESFFYWVTDYKKWHLTFRLGQEDEFLKALKMEGEIYSAFTVAELGSLLPAYVKIDSGFDSDAECYIKSQKSDDEYKIYIDYTTNIIIYFSKNEADARAKMLVYLLENKLMELPKESSCQE